MGGQSVKRRREAIEAWAWRWPGSLYVSVSTEKPAICSCGCGKLVGRNVVMLCASVFRRLTGIVTRKGRDFGPVRVRIPAWTVLKGGG